jgi:hypothetical protein
MLAVNGSPLKRAPLAAMVVAIEAAVKTPLSNLEWVDCRVKCGRKPGEANT